MAAKKRTTTRKLKHSTRPDLDKLSAQDIRFAQHYADSDNATEAYKQAGYFNSGGPDYLVGKAAWVLVRKSKIRQYIRDLRQQAADVAEITVALLAQGFKRTAFADRTAIFDSKGNIRHPHQWPAELKSIIVGIEVIPPKKAGGKPRYKVRFETGTRAKEILAGWKGMIGMDAVKGGEVPNPLVIGGEARTDDL